MEHVVKSSFEMPFNFWNAMRCPFCNSDQDKVIDSRPSRDGRSVRRRRECLSCDKRFTTYEYVETVPLYISKNDKRVVEYDRNKLVKGIRIAAAKRPVTMDDIDQVVNNVESRIHARAEKEVTSREIGDYVMQELQKLDKVTYIRYASVYRRFQDVGAFTEEVKKLK